MKTILRLFIFTISMLMIASFCFAERAIKVSHAETFSEQRVALVIGNGAYKNSPLKNPPNDASDMAKKLKEMNFRVNKLINATQLEMRTAIRRFGRDLKKGGVGLFFYAGHGMQVRGRNYLIPIGADIQDEDETQDYAVDAGMVLRKMQTAENRLNIVLLDACRNNPFARSFRSSQSGLAQMDAPSGSMVSYATSPGKTAADGGGRNGVFTKHVLKELENSSHLELIQLMKRVGKGVQKETGKRQVPWVASSITGDFYFSVKNISVNSGKSPKINAEEEFWRAIKDSRYQQDFKDYMAVYPKGRFIPVAKIKLRHLSSSKKGEKYNNGLKNTSKPKKAPLLFFDTFKNNENNWTMWPNGEHYSTGIENNSFVMETKNTMNSAEFLGKKISLPKNFDIELTSTWKKGVDNRAYGLAIGSDRQNRYNFGVSGNGWTFISGYKDNTVIDPAPMPWKSGTANIGKGWKSNELRVEARESTYTYFVNNKPVGTVYIEIPHNRLKVGFFVENKQKVFFDNLKITRHE